MSSAIVILAGGLGTRIGGDKALRMLHGRPLIEWVLQAVRPQGDEVLISANSNAEALAQYACPVIADHMDGYAGPLAGLQAAMQESGCDWIASVPCDAPFLPPDLLVRLHAAVDSVGGEAAVAMTAGRRQPAIALYRRSVLQSLNAYLADGGRKVMTWQDSLRLQQVAFDDVAAFINLNSAQELALANQILDNGGTHDDIRRALA